MTELNEFAGRTDWPPLGQAVAAVAWCSFLSACFASLICFAFIDPLSLAGELSPAGIWSSRTAAYTVAFIFFWFIAVLAAALSVFMIRSDGAPGESPRRSAP